MSLETDFRISHNLKKNKHQCNKLAEKQTNERCVISGRSSQWNELLLQLQKRPKKSTLEHNQIHVIRGIQTMPAL